ncbi:MAG: hypothetical protein MZW92_45830 [Comamonadaceae bacterium]|nr:hypothetical protein [Comamonadaceae bacterium]
MQQACSEDRAANLAASVAGIRDRARPGCATGAAAGTAHRRVFLPDRRHSPASTRPSRFPALDRCARRAGAANWAS